MRALLVSTYDLGRQPFGLASPAAWLRKAGVEVDCADTSRDPLDDARIRAVSMIAFYLPMHTATRMAGPLIERARRVNPSARLCAYGLYAPLNADWLRERGIDDVFGPEAEEGLVSFAKAQGSKRNAKAQCSTKAVCLSVPSCIANDLADDANDLIGLLNDWIEATVEKLAAAAHGQPVANFLGLLQRNSQLGDEILSA